MIEPEFPPDEARRLQSLRELGVLYTPAEDRFDRITRLASRLLNVPMSMVSLVDGTSQWFKSSRGLEATETSRAVSFCGHAILGDDTMVVPDARSDPRFSDNPLVTGEPHIRFYAGHPLRGSDGSKLGTLCVIDRQPRHLGPADLEVLRDLAGWVESELRMAAFSQVERELIAELDDLRRKAMLDPLTRLWNREGITNVLHREIERSLREQIPMGVIMADLDDFKRINDSHGHPVGDAALNEVAKTLRSCVRPYDAIGRYGGEEFLIVLGKCDGDAVTETAERIRGRVARCEVPTPTGPISLTLSLGVIALDRADATDAAGLVEAADRALYRAKAAGRNRVEIGSLEG
jgi:diguanylate cyclase (GGDEF)-like protein